MNGPERGSPRSFELVHPSCPRGKADPDEGLRVDATFEEAVQAQRAAWLLSSRPGGLEDSMSKLIRQ